MNEVPTLPCIVCGSPLESATGMTDNNQPSRGLAFLTNGHYGSTFFDPMDGTRLEINVCDECMKKAVVRKAVLASVVVRASARVEHFWPDDEDETAEPGGTDHG